MNEARIVRAAAARGATLAETAATLGCSVGKARRLWLALGLPIARCGPRPGSVRASAYAAEIERELRAGRSICEVALGRGVSRQAISDLARRHGFPVRELRRLAPLGPFGGGSGSASASNGEKDLRGVMVWVPGR